MLSIKIYSYDSSGKKVATKTFNDLSNEAQKADLTDLAKDYADLTDATTSEADLVTTEALDISE